METMPRLPLQKEVPEDTAAIIGLLTGMAAVVTWLVGIMIPLVPWILAAVLGLIMIACAIVTRSRMRWMILAGGVLSLLPLAIFILVQSLPLLERTR